MPLDHRDTDAAFSANVKELLKAGHAKAQALAIAYRMRREKRKKRT